MQSNYHQNQLSRIKKSIRASFVAYVQRGQENFLRVRKDGEETDFEFNGSLNQLTPQAYAELQQSLQNYYYGQ